MESQPKRAVCFSKSLPKDSTAPFANQSTPGATSQRSKSAETHFRCARPHAQSTRRRREGRPPATPSPRIRTMMIIYSINIISLLSNTVFYKDYQYFLLKC